jgi:hypothetical protein
MIEALMHIATIALMVLVGVIGVYLFLRLAGKVIKSVVVILCVIAILAVVYFVFIRSVPPAPLALSLPWQMI